MNQSDEMNCTFFNPYLKVPCEMCDFVAKSKTDLQVHVKAKHEECLETDTNNLEPDIVVVAENEDIEEYETDQNVVEGELETFMENHTAQKQSTCEIKLEVFLLSLNGNEDVFEVRKNLIENLENKMKLRQC